ncbi:MAG TPA: riboflavin kinase [Candidatus Dormibacteraeota bacterium]|nr:riboflavin kinase [Candidatus Dormibacteraeota bacterium]
MKSVTLTGQVTRFAGTGRRLGYPTANIRSKTNLAEGVYFGIADLAEFSARPSLIFVGVPTTVRDSESRVEVHVLDIPDIDYYDQPLSVKIMYFHRPNKHFESLDELIAAMHADEAAARSWFSKNPLAPAEHPKHT